MAKKRRKTAYFTKVHEQAIIDFNNSTDLKEREHLYETYIEPVFSEMVDKIVFTYRFTSLPNIDSLRQECKIWLTTVIQKYDPTKGSKAFSYFSVITKNWFIHKVKKNSKAKKMEVPIEDLMVKSKLDEKLIVDHGYYRQRAEKEFWENLWIEIESWDTGNLKPNEEKVLEAIKLLLANPDSIEIFNKKAIYLYIREITGLNTKQIVNNLNKMRAKYRLFKKDWNEGKL
ncbi:MAG: hypothetical protein VX206_03480 [Pseudomonadota bacterium]|nr:hypothetical protein [Pseudomonadota bacterium]